MIEYIVRNPRSLTKEMKMKRMIISIILVALASLWGCATTPQSQNHSSYQNVSWNQALLQCPAGKNCSVHLEDRWHMWFLDKRNYEGLVYKCLILYWQYPTFDLIGSHKSVQYLCLKRNRSGVWKLEQTEGTAAQYPLVQHHFSFHSKEEALHYATWGLLDYWKKVWRGKRL